MNSITSSNIWFAIDIDTGTNETIENMFLEDGHFRFTTDNYDPVATSATYEDNSNVIGTWYKDNLKMDGIDETLTSIDLAYGTGYSTLNGWSFSIINRCTDGTPFHRAITNTTSTYLIGSNVTFYVVIDNVFYKRWVGIVSDYAISEDYFKINCDDAFIKTYGLFPKTTIGDTNYPNANVDSKGKVVPVCMGDVKYVKPVNIEQQELNFKIGSSFPLVRIKPDISTGSGATSGSFTFGIPNYESAENNQFMAYPDTVVQTTIANIAYMPGIQYYTVVNNNQTALCIALPKTYNTANLIGKYVTISNTAIVNEDVTNAPKNMKILSVVNATTDMLDNADSYLVYLIIEGNVDNITDYTNFYGDVTDRFIDNFDEISEDSMYVYIWEVSNKYILSESENIQLVSGFTSNDKIIAQEGDVMCYKKADNDLIFRFNPLNVNAISNNILSMNAGTTEVYHIPESAKWLRYAPSTDPTFLENLGATVPNNILTSTITWDDDQLGNDVLGTPLLVLSSATPTYNVNSTRFVETPFSTTDTVLSFIMTYNIDTFNPNMYTRVLPTPIWNTSSYLYFQTGGGGTWESYLSEPTFISKLRSEVYGITDSTFNGKILTASMGYVESPISRVRFGGIKNSVGQEEAIGGACIPNALSKALTYPDPVDTYNMLGLDFHAPEGYAINNGLNGTSKFGITRPDKSGNYSVYNGGISETNEKLMLDRQLSSSISDINDTLWDFFDENGDISIVLELTAWGSSNGGWEASPAVTWASKTVHCIGLTGFIDYTPEDLYVRVHGECLSSVPYAFDLLLTTYNNISYDGRTNLINYRGDWNIGRQLTEQQNLLDYINELCAQSWVVGWTNRNGNVQLKAIEDESTTHTHNDNIIIRNSIKNFNLTPITKVCNELTIHADYNAITNTYDKVYAVDNIDQDEFPAYYEGTDNTIELGSDADYDTYTSINCYVADTEYMSYTIENSRYNGILSVGDIIRINPYKTLVYDDDINTNLLASYYYDGNDVTSDQGEFGNVIKGTEGQSHMVVDVIVSDNPDPSYIVDDVAETWSTIDLDSLDTDNQIYSMCNVGDGIVLAGGTGAYILRSEDYGVTWDQIATSSFVTNAICDIGNGIVLAGGYSFNNLNDIFRSTDSGETWTPIDISGGSLQISSICYLEDGIVLIGTKGTFGNGDVYRSTDYGVTWSKIEMSDNTEISAICYLENGIVLASPRGTSNDLYRSTDYGATWDTISVSTMPDNVDIISLCSIGNGIALAGAIGSSTILYKSTNYGVTWSVINVITPVGSPYISCFSNVGDGIVLLTITGSGSAEQNGVYKSTDYGATWTMTEQMSNMNEICYVDRGIVLTAESELNAYRSVVDGIPPVGYTAFKCLKTSVTGKLTNILTSYPNRKFVVASYFSEITKIDESSTDTTWRNYVQGIDSYGDAKDIWNTCKNAWYENKTINKYPDSLSNLTWFNNRNNFYDSTSYDEIKESAYLFFKKAITWCTRQKYKIVYQVPLTSDTIQIELMDKVSFHDPILTGYTNGDATYLNGYVSSISCKPYDKVMEIELTAEMVYSTPPPVPMTGDIIELASNVDNIIESGDNTDWIVEVGSA